MFRSELDVRPFKPDEWVVLHELLWHDPLGGNTPDGEPVIVSVPRGFITDLASIPRVLRGVLDANGLSRRPAVLHDYLYCSQPCSRAAADALFRRALAAEGVGLIARNFYYVGVRAGGALYWKLRRAGLGREDFVPPGYWEAHP